MRLIKSNVGILISVISIILAIYASFFRPMNTSVSEQRIFFVETKKLMAEYVGLKVEQKKYDSIVKVIGEDLHNLIERYNTKAKEFEKNKTIYSASSRQLRLEELKLMEKDISRIQDMNKKQYEKIYNETVAKVYIEITNYIKIYGEENKCDYILGSNIVAGDILYGAPIHDITDAILIKLNEKYYSNNKNYRYDK